MDPRSSSRPSVQRDYHGGTKRSESEQDVRVRTRRPSQDKDISSDDEDPGGNDTLESRLGVLPRLRRATFVVTVRMSWRETETETERDRERLKSGKRGKSERDWGSQTASENNKKIKIHSDRSPVPHPRPRLLSLCLGVWRLPLPGGCHPLLSVCRYMFPNESLTLLLLLPGSRMCFSDAASCLESRVSSGIASIVWNRES